MDIKKGVIQEFKTLKISTRTIIIHTNIKFDIKKLYNSISIIPFKVIEKKR